MISYDGDGHLVFGTKKHWKCILCDFWYPLKHWRVYFEN